MVHLKRIFPGKGFLLALVILMTTPGWGVANENPKRVKLKKQIQNQNPHFVKNEGQVQTTEGEPASRVQYTLKTGNISIYFLKNRIAYVYPKVVRKATPDHPVQDSITKTVKLYRMDMKLKGANPGSQLKGKGELNTISNYYNQGLEVTHVPHFRKVVYKNIYEGIDLRFKFKNNRLKYEFLVKKGGDPDAIQVGY